MLETNASGSVTSDERYLAYGKQRDSGKVVTDHRFTGHPSATLGNRKEDASGLQYFNARFCDPVMGMFVSPDTIVPQPGLASDYNRYLAFRGNPLKYTDPSGHVVTCAMDNKGNMTCKDETVGAQTVAYDPNSNANPSCFDNPNCDPHATEKLLIGLTVASFAVFMAPVVIPALMEGACADGDCTNEISTANKASTVASKVAEPVNHIVLGLEKYGLKQLAEKVGGRTLMNDLNWKDSLMQAIADPTTKFTVNLDGLSGSSPYSQVMNAVQKGIAANASPTNWELAQLYIAGKLQEVTFILNGAVIDNPFQ